MLEDIRMGFSLALYPPSIQLFPLDTMYGPWHQRYVKLLNMLQNVLVGIHFTSPLDILV